MYRIDVYVPEAHLEAVKRAMFNAGGGRLGGYDRCAWQVLGRGQFRPLAGSDPTLGAIGEETSVSEYRVEMICSRDCLPAVLHAMTQAHPYETPAYGVVALVNFSDQ